MEFFICSLMGISLGYTLSLLNLLRYRKKEEEFKKITCDLMFYQSENEILKLEIEQLRKKAKELIEDIKFYNTSKNEKVNETPSKKRKK